MCSCGFSQSFPIPHEHDRDTKKKVVKAWADIGSHGGIFAFGGGGECARRYQGMMHIYETKVTADLKPCTITYDL